MEFAQPQYNTGSITQRVPLIFRRLHRYQQMVRLFIQKHDNLTELIRRS